MKFMVQSVNPIQPAEPRQAAAGAPSRGSDPFSELLEATVKERSAPAGKRPEAAKRPAPGAAPSQVRARSESLARGETPDAAPAAVKNTNASTATPQEAPDETKADLDGAANTPETVGAEVPDSDADGADASVQVALAPVAPAAVAPAAGESGAPTQEPEANAATDAATQQPVSGTEDPALPPDVNAAPALQAATDKPAQSAVPQVAAAPASDGAPLPAADGTADAADSDNAVPAPVQAPSMKQASANAQTQAAAETAAPQADAATTLSTPASKEQATAPQPALPNHAAATANPEAAADSGADVNPAPSQPQNPAPAAQAKSDDAGAARAGDNAASPPSSAPDESAVRSQPNTPQPHSTEPVRALAASFNPANVNAAHAADAAGTPLTGRALAVEIVSQLRAGKQQFEIRLDPPELGRVDVRLEMDRAGNVTTKMTVDRPETLELMQREARGLERALQSAGLKTDAGGLEFSLRSHAQADFSGMQDRSGSPQPRPDLIAVDEGAPVEAAAESYRAAAFARGGVDIRV